MQVVKDPRRDGRPFGVVPKYIRDVIRADAFQAFQNTSQVRLTKRAYEGAQAYFFEDNARMFRIVISKGNIGAVLSCYRLLKPEKRSPARPQWVELTSLRKEFDKTDTTGMVSHFVAFLSRKSDYPLADTDKIRLSDDLCYMRDQTKKKDPNPIYFCGNIKEVLYEDGNGWLLRLCATKTGVCVYQEYLLKKGCFYGKPPAPGNWVIIKENHLTAVVSDRDLTRYFTYFQGQE